MKCTQKLVSFAHLLKVFTYERTSFRCDFQCCIPKLRRQRTVHTNTHNGVKFRCQIIIETILNVLAATIYSTAHKILHDTQTEHCRSKSPHTHLR